MGDVILLTPPRRNDLGFLNTSRSQKIVHEVWFLV
jgi:hypothetical protein